MLLLLSEEIGQLLMLLWFPLTLIIVLLSLLFLLLLLFSLVLLILLRSWLAFEMRDCEVRLRMVLTDDFTLLLIFMRLECCCQKRWTVGMEAAIIPQNSSMWLYFLKR